MKSLKITLIITLFFAALTSCTKQDLNEDDLQVGPELETTFFTGGQADD